MKKLEYLFKKNNNLTRNVGKTVTMSLHIE